MLPAGIDELRIRALKRLWDPEAIRGGRLRSAGVRALRIGHCVVRDLSSGELTLQAMSLVYTTLLALVPLLAVSFSVLKAFGVHNQAEPILLNFLRPLGTQGAELTAEIIQWVEEMRVGVLGSLGVAFLIYSVVSLIQKIESAFNSSWHITQRQRLSKRFGDYLSVILIGPVLIFAALGITARMMASKMATTLLAWEPLGFLVRLGAQMVPYLLAIAAFTVIYLYVPNTRVRLRSALAGSVVGGIAWQSLGWLFASVVISSARYSGFYSGFAILLLFMIWLYLNWLILLLGASIAFYHQHPEYLGLDRGSLRLSGRLREKLALLTMFLIGKRHFESGQPWSVEALSRQVRLPSDALSRVLLALEENGLLAVAGDSGDEYLPAKALETVTVQEVLDAVRTSDEGPLLNPARLPPEAQIDQLERRLQTAISDALAGSTVRDLVLADRTRATTGETGGG